jgi:hypothetical protein
MLFPDIKEVLGSLAGRSNLFAPSNKEALSFRWYGLRQADYNHPCSCKSVQGTSDGVACSRCLSTGYLFTDKLIKAYSWLGILGVAYPAGPGLISTQQKNIVIEHNYPINKFDFILDLDFNPETGELRQPFKILRYFRVADSTPIVGQGSKLKYWKVILEEASIDGGLPGIADTNYTYRGNRSNDRAE